MTDTPTQTTTEITKDQVDRAFTRLCTALKSRGVDAQKRVMAHVRAVTGKPVLLPVYHNDANISHAIKLGLYFSCWKALEANGGKGDWSLLKGQERIGAGDKRVDPVTETATETEVAAPATTPEPPQESTDPIVDLPPRSVKPAASRPLAVADESADELTRLLIQKIAPHLVARNDRPAELDGTKVADIADGVARNILTEWLKDDFDAHLKKSLGNGSFPTDRVEEIFNQLADKLVHRVVMVTPTGEVKPLDGSMHPQVPQVAAWINAGVPVWAWGAAGSGKTHMARQIAAILGVDPHVISVDPTMTVAKLMGYRNVANGDFVPGFVYKPYKDGGLLAMDEIDTGDPGVIASANALLSNAHYLFPSGETIERHRDFHVLALANTKGTGAVAGYSARNRLDAATLDRFAVIEIKYDSGLEQVLSYGAGNPGKPWQPGKPASEATQLAFVEWVQKAREYCKDSVLISPRASINGCRALRAGIPLADVVGALVTKLCTADTVKRITDQCGIPEAKE